MFKNLLVPFVFGLAVAHTARADAGDTCSTHTDCVVSSGYASANPWASSEEFCYNTTTYNGVTVGVCSDCFGCSAGPPPYGNSIDESCPSKCTDTISSYTSCGTEIATEVANGAKCWDGAHRCPPLHKKGGKWCSMYTGGQNICCGDDCCKPDGGAIAGIIIGTVVGLTLLIVSCCYCGRCGCFAYRRDQLIATAVATRPQQPQVIYVQQAPAKVDV